MPSEHQGCLGKDLKRNSWQNLPSEPTAASEPDPDNMTDATWQMTTHSYCYRRRKIERDSGER